jgi:hypothetical protein
LEATIIGREILDEKYCLFKVNPFADERDIINELKKHLKTLSPKAKGRKRETTANPWKVYDMHYNKGMNFSKITKELFGIIKSPSYDNEAKSRYEQVKRANKKAEEMIEQVTPLK